MNIKDSKNRFNRGQSKTWFAWYNMIQRCFNKSVANYKDYGGRGITVCSAWINSFDAFLNDLGPSPEGCLLDRIDNEKSYYKENCRWTDRSTSDHNKRIRYDNLSGVKGVCRTSKGRYMAYGNKNGVRSMVYSGYSKEAAIAARKLWEQETLCPL